jgi:hypothetical protein
VSTGATCLYAAGGTVYFNCAGFAGTAAAGSITATGGNGNSANGLASGGGGRIAFISSGDDTAWSGNLIYPGTPVNLNTFKNTVRAYGGTATGTYGGGAPGTIYTKHSALANGDLIINNGGIARIATSGETELVSATDNSNAIYSSVDTNNVNVTNGTTPYANKNGLYSGATIHIWPTASPAPNPTDGSRISIPLTGNGDNTWITTSGLFPTITTGDYAYRVTYKLDHIDIQGNAIVNMNGADLWLTSCDLHSASTTLAIPAGSSLTGNALATPTCSTLTSTGTTINFSGYY